MADSLLYDLAGRLLEMAVDALDDPPERRYVTDGDPTAVDDCRFVAVALSPNGLGHSVLTKARGSMAPTLPTSQTNIRTARFAVYVLSTDCWPTHGSGEDGNPPDPAVISAAAERVLVDRMDVWEALRDEATAGTLFDSLLDAGPHGVEVAGPTTAMGPSGGTAGSRVEVTATLLRLPELGGS